jgi:hypothetical protein
MRKLAGTGQKIEKIHHIYRLPTVLYICIPGSSAHSILISFHIPAITSHHNASHRTASHLLSYFIPVVQYSSAYHPAHISHLHIFTSSHLHNYVFTHHIFPYQISHIKYHISHLTSHASHLTSHISPASFLSTAPSTKQTPSIPSIILILSIPRNPALQHERSRELAGLLSNPLTLSTSSTSSHSLTGRHDGGDMPNFNDNALNSRPPSVLPRDHHSPGRTRRRRGEKQSRLIGRSSSSSTALVPSAARIQSRLG